MRLPLQASEDREGIVWNGHQNAHRYCKTPLAGNRIIRFVSCKMPQPHSPQSLPRHPTHQSLQVTSLSEVACGDVCKNLLWHHGYLTAPTHSTSVGHVVYNGDNRSELETL